MPSRTAGSLNKETLRQGLRELARRDPDLARTLKSLGPPPMWERQPGFHTLVHIILEQQVSLASARAAMSRLLAAASPLTPERFLEIGNASLKTIGFSRQKTAYCRHLAESVISGSLNFRQLTVMSDTDARSELLKIKGIGPWSADIYLLMALRRPDIWPIGDLALAVAAHEVKGLPARPGNDELARLSNGWRPWRAVAARMLWHHYLSTRRQ